ncbi:asparagine synthase (glutamine-hydrolyzing) [Neglecta sp. X4]|uniref:asparagine synthase (glutamine-hydrolyzing) n=1 Tax=unclassified Neglectibacter TaxID=2632164 RepID=UPI00136938DB|nr:MULTISPECIES: asparagine synthase (glutamine-hydrolyzing) [unclassified Neglectibacter]NBI18453.1 asparagine synthase (glutamine-hydrolyzing) [Neglectibacter sp. 59]NBJ74418.1 asparagine synthase (glutamine-hydrolyzing) [Neglectibacter sp. X4]NCE80414.1 asparagine synthase (glutamine-hydrolyzing) [Neglectibacter sp. X58]
MCGFVGFMNSPQVQEPGPVIRAMADRIIHRGPDDAHYYDSKDISLGFRRLSIIDLEGGRQPILNEDGSKVLVFNGEIYNYQELREDLLKRGHSFTTKSDSETILHGYEEFGPEILQKLRGMFAFVIWDKNNKKLFGARDIFGIKPFYYYKKDGQFMFGSEIKSFLSHPCFEKELDEALIPEYLSYEYIPDERTIFKNVWKLPGSHCFTYQNGELQVERYYRVQYNIEEDKSLEYWEKEITREFTESVAMHQISDVEVGCFLSSGVDSSYVVKEISKGTKKVKTFSVGYEEEKYSELSYAQDFSKVVGVPNISNKVSADEFFDAMPEIQYFMDEPLPNPSEIPLYFLAKNARKYVKVVLSGEGADELFGGYPMYLQGGHFQDYTKKAPRPLRKMAGAVAGRLPEFKGKHFLVRGAMEPWQRFMRANYVFQSGERQKFLKRPITSRLPEEYSKRYFDEVPDLDEPTQLQYVDMHTWMIYDILLKADRMSMANSLELRVPFLDKKMLELSTRIPTRFRADCATETTKKALRSAAIKQLPERTANKKKLGFPVPLSDWLREDKYYNKVKAAFQSDIAEKFFVTKELMKLLDDHKAGKARNMQKIWSFYTFIVWYDQFFVKN